MYIKVWLTLGVSWLFASVARQRPGNNARHSGDIVAKAFYNSHELPLPRSCTKSTLPGPLLTAYSSPSLVYKIYATQPTALPLSYTKSTLLIPLLSYCHLFAPQQL